MLVGVGGGGGPAETDDIVHPVGQPLGQRNVPGEHHGAHIPGCLMLAQGRPGLGEFGKGFGLFDLLAGGGIDAEFQCDIVPAAHIIVRDIAFYPCTGHSDSSQLEGLRKFISGAPDMY